MTWQPFMKCPICGGKNTEEVVSVDGLPVEICSECGFRLSEFVHDLEASIIGVPDEWQQPEDMNDTAILDWIERSVTGVQATGSGRLKITWLDRGSERETIGDNLRDAVKKANGVTAVSEESPT